LWKSTINLIYLYVTSSFLLESCDRGLREGLKDFYLQFRGRTKPWCNVQSSFLLESWGRRSRENLKDCYLQFRGGWVMVCSASFNNISVILWWFKFEVIHSLDCNVHSNLLCFVLYYICIQSLWEDCLVLKKHSKRNIFWQLYHSLNIFYCPKTWQ
jgi:hypothetical protein